jgi:phosphoribosyl 1,2-cyclic phosphodiesterase
MPTHMAKPLNIVIVDDSAIQADIARALLEKAGHTVVVYRSGADALKDLPAARPDCILMDIMMPGLDGYELCRRLRAMEALAATKLVMMSTKAYPFDRARAFAIGADGYFVKPLQPATFIAELERLVADTLVMTFWGVRGTMPVSRVDAARYGGNTSCVSLSFPDGRLFIFDAGTGIKALSDALMAAKRTRLDAKILITHPHWDHINAIPFFVPFYVQGNQFEICGPAHGDIGVRELVSEQMNGVFFPVTVHEFAASISYRDLTQGDFDIGGVKVRTMLLSHPGNCLGYRLEHGGRSFCYITDNELFPPDSEFYCAEYVERLADFVRAADVLITDCTYLDEEYPRKTRWGHSTPSQVADLAERAQPKTLYLFHHDPDQSDAAVDAKLAQVRERLMANGSVTQVIAPEQLAEFEVRKNSMSKMIATLSLKRCRPTAGCARSSTHSALAEPNDLSCRSFAEAAGGWSLPERGGSWWPIRSTLRLVSTGRAGPSAGLPRPAMRTNRRKSSALPMESRSSRRVGTFSSPMSTAAASTEWRSPPRRRNGFTSIPSASTRRAAIAPAGSGSHNRRETNPSTVNKNSFAPSVSPPRWSAHYLPPSNGRNGARRCCWSTVVLRQRLRDESAGYLYLAETTGNRVRAIARHSQPVTDRTVVLEVSHPDNLELDQHNRLWIASPVRCEILVMDPATETTQSVMRVSTAKSEQRIEAIEARIHNGASWVDLLTPELWEPGPGMTTGMILPPDDGPVYVTGLGDALIQLKR